MLRPYTASGTKNVRQRGGHAVSGIGGLRCVLEPQEMRDHRAHLTLPCSSGAHDGLLDHRRCILRDVESLLLRGKQDDPSRMSQHERGADVLMIEGVLEGEHSGLVTFDQLRDLVMQLGKTV